MTFSARSLTEDASSRIASAAAASPASASPRVPFMGRSVTVRPRRDKKRSGLADSSSKPGKDTQAA